MSFAVQRIRSMTMAATSQTIRFSAVLSLVVAAGGCCREPIANPGVSASQAVTRHLVAPINNAQVAAIVTPPIGWKAEPIKTSPKHTHQVWLSPSGNTAYGVIYFTMPWPVGPDLALWAFLNQMKRTEGQATLLSKRQDNALPGVRFVAEGGLYTVHANLILDGFKGWAVYAGTVRGKPVDESELDLAIAAREQTSVQRD